MIQYINPSAGRTEAFFKAARALSDYVCELCVTPEQNDRFIELSRIMLIEAEKGAFMYGVGIAGAAAGAAALEGREIRESDFREATEAAEKR